MGKVSHYSARILEIVFKKMGIFYVYESKFGIKNINLFMLSNPSCSTSSRLLEVNPEDLYLGPDFLKDEYTLLGVKITDSPHLKLMMTIRNRGSIKDTEYFNRMCSGSLDWRHSVVPKNIDYFVEKYESALRGIHNGELKPVCIYSLNQKYYIFDGKHRAALCAQLGKPVKCRVVDSSIIVSNVFSYLFKLCECKDGYGAHNSFLSAYNIRRDDDNG